MSLIDFSHMITATCKYAMYCFVQRLFTLYNALFFMYCYDIYCYNFCNAVIYVIV